MTKTELDIMIRTDCQELKAACHKTVEDILQFLGPPEDQVAEDEEAFLDFVARAVLYAYKLGADTAEAVVKDGVEFFPAETLDVEFTVVDKV